MYCLHISNLSTSTQSVFFKLFSSAPNIVDVVDVLQSFGYSLDSPTCSMISVKETSKTSWDVIQTTTIVHKGWLWGDSTQHSHTKLFSFTSLPLIYNPDFNERRSKTTQTPKIPDGSPLPVHSSPSSSTSSTLSANYEDAINELKSKLELPNFGLLSNV